MENKTRHGLFAAVAAFVAWGLVPIYWRQIRTVPAFEILAHRMVWSVVFVAVLLSFCRGWKAIPQRPRALAISALRGALVGANWLIFIWAVNAGHIVETSMGYFINPLLSLVFGMIIFREKLSPRQWLAVLFAIGGVIVAALETGHGFPWIAVGLALTFACYGVLRKMADIAPLPGLFLETALMTPLALAYLFWKPGAVSLWPVFSHTSLFLIGGGVITAFPLLWFAQAARQLRLSTLGFLQFLAPTISFLVGVCVFQEAFSKTRLAAFCLIWAGVFIFSLDAWLRSREFTQPVSLPIAME